jgi:hypothetical protein
MVSVFLSPPLSDTDRWKHTSRMVSQISSIEKNYLLCFFLFEDGWLAKDIRAIANKIGLFRGYEPGLDVLEHVLVALATNEQNLVDRIAPIRVFQLSESAFARNDRELIRPLT